MRHARTALVLQIDGAAACQRPVLQALDVLPAPGAAAPFNAVHQSLRLSEAPEREANVLSVRQHDGKRCSGLGQATGRSVYDIKAIVSS